MEIPEPKNVMSGGDSYWVGGVYPWVDGFLMGKSPRLGRESGGQMSFLGR